MHEISLMQNLLKLVETHSKKHRLKNVTRIVVRIGELAGASPDALEFAFEAISPGTMADGAEFVLEHIPARSRCTVCGHEFSAGVTARVCPVCGKPAIFIEGRELYLQTLEGDQEEDKHGD